MEPFRVKQETIEQQFNNKNNNAEESSKRKKKIRSEAPVIDLDCSSDEEDSFNQKRSRVSDDLVLPAGFLDPLPPKPSCRNFWKAGDFDEGSDANWDTSPGGMDHVRVHPRFLHSNATSHKWVLGAFAELLDNSLDECCNGATYVNIDMLRNKKDGNRMLLIEDNGGGMDPDKMRQCMSLGYSLKSKVADTIGQYGNGFKTSSMRLGADVIVFSQCAAKDGKRSTQSIGLLSYTFLRGTGKEDIVVPMLDYVKDGGEWKKIIRSSPGDWNMNLEAVTCWSPFVNEADLLKQFDHMKGQGTRIIIYNLWEDDQGQLELDFDADEEDIQIRGVNRDEKNIQMAQKYPNSRHFLTYRHSLRSYASILYLRIPPGFRMILRGKDVQHHNIVNDMMMTTEVTYRPQPGVDKLSNDSSIVAVVTMGFVKDAKSHIDVQGYNVYHKNRLIKPFWRLWNSTGSDGRGVIGVLEANFVEPAHDKQGFERTIVLSRLEMRLIQMQKTYWRTYCHKIGYAPRVNRNNLDDKETSPDFSRETSRKKKTASTPPVSLSKKHQKPGPSLQKSTPFTGNLLDDDPQTTSNLRHTNNSFYKEKSANTFTPNDLSSNMQIVTHTQSKFQNVFEDASTPDLNQLLEENRQLKEKLEMSDEDILGDLLRDLERERNRRKALEAQIEELKGKCEKLNKEQEIAIDTFAAQRERRDIEEEALRKKLKEATTVIQDLVERVKHLELEKVKRRNWSAV
ncbi:protein MICRORCHIDIA 7-like [Bidens hawaiensis]|uniref:protein MICRORCHIDIA 7-like n=1 Tax=Bidens hawaiensis TaxID=980011 RepID=UPI00404B470B